MIRPPCEQPFTVVQLQELFGKDHKHKDLCQSATHTVLTNLHSLLTYNIDWLYSSANLVFNYEKAEHSIQLFSLIPQTIIL